jgi:lysophospholipase L1-like esterase
MTALRRLSRAIAIVLAPVLLVQARQVRSSIPWLPPAAEPWHGRVDGPDPLRLLVFGDSTAVGVGVESLDDGLGGNLARALHARTGRGIDWMAVGESGATSRDLIERYLGEATGQRYDVVFLSAGANDALTIRSRRAFRRDVRLLLRRLRLRNRDASILVASLPAFFRFQSLRNPLRWVLYLHSRNLEDAARTEVRKDPRAHMSAPPPAYGEGFFAHDGFHPSASGYRDWADFALTDAEHMWA